MKKFTFILLLLPFIFASFNSMATLKDSVITIVSPVANATIKSWQSFNFEIVVQNVGTEKILASSSTSFVAIGYISGSTYYPWATYPLNRDINPGDTIHYSHPFTILTTASGQLQLFLGVTADNKSVTGRTVIINLTTSGIKELAKAINSVNYSNNNLNIYFNSKVSTSANLLLTNLSGQVIDQRTMNISQGEMQESINLGTLPKGIYILNMQTPYGTDSKKFVIQ